MKYIVIVACAGIVSIAAASFTFGHDNRSEATRLSKELKQLDAQNTQLKQQNNRLHDRVIALRDDPRLAERRARESGKLARKNELIFQFNDKPTAQTVAVTLKLKPQKLILAGQPVEPKALKTQLTQLKSRFDVVNLTVEHPSDIDMVRKQQVMDLVKQANLASVKTRVKK